MGRSSIALSALLFAAGFAPDAVRGDALDSSRVAGSQLPCALDFQATSDAAAVPNTTTLHLQAGQMRGTVRLYGSTQLWTATVDDAVATVNRARIAEQAVAIRTSGPVLGVEFQPEAATCSMIAAVRPRAQYDAPDPALAIEAREAGTIAPPACDRPYGPARVIRAAEPDTPVLAQQQGIQGVVSVAVALDASGQVVAAAIQRTPSAILNNASIVSARRSTYQPAVVACHPVASGYQFNVSFSQR